MDNSDSDEIQEEYEIYGSTPPRTRILRKNKERHNRNINGGSTGKAPANGQPKVTVKRNLSRRNTVTIMFDELITKAEEDAKEKEIQANPASKGAKRSLKLLRGSERDLKLNIPTQHVAFTSTEDATDSTSQNGVPLTPQSRQVETCKRFICLSSKRVYCNDEKPPQEGSTQLRHSNSMNRHQLRPRVSSLLTDFHGPQGAPFGTRGMTTLSRSRPSTWDVDFKNYNDTMQSRANYHQMLTAMLTQGGVGRSGLGSSASSVQGADTKSTTQRHISREEYMWQSELKDLIWLELQAWHAGRSLSDEDDHICRERAGVSDLIHNIMHYRFERRISSRGGGGEPGDSSDSGLETDECTGCNSLFCRTCMDAQNKALGEVEDLMNRLERAEALFPSSRAFADHYPSYNSSSFCGRVKAMCLWYNMTRHQRLKLIILSRLLALVQSKYYPWPSIGGYDGGPSSMDSEQPAVESSPSDSNSSTGSTGFAGSCIGGFGDFSGATEMLNIATSRLIQNNNVGPSGDHRVSPYRKYIENILKTRGLNQSMSFLDRIHTHVLSKAQLTLEKPNTDIFHKHVPLQAEEELQRYGVWSPEALSLNLPSYKSQFLFLSRVPLEVVYEFLRMRLEQKPTNPSPLSVRQLMRELKEGLRIATQQREKIVLYVDTLINCCSDAQKKSLQNSKFTILKTFDDALRDVFKDYLGYIEQWCLMDHGVCQTNLLEEEWKFIQGVVPNIEGGCSMACSKFCIIMGDMLTAIGKRLIGGIEELEGELKTLASDNRKQNLFAIFRELQYLIREERETCMKTISFSKFIFKTDNICINTDDEYKFREAVLSLKCTIPEAIERTEKLCDLADLDDLDEADKVSIMSRCREILIQGFRLSFDFHQHLSEFIPSEHRGRMARSMLHTVILWTKFMARHYAVATATPIYTTYGTPITPAARGNPSISPPTVRKRPLWMQHSLDFLLTACDIRYTAHLTEEQFSALRSNMDECIKHLVGAGCGENRNNGGAESGYNTASSWGSGATPDLSTIHTPPSNRFPRSGNSSPVRRSTYRSQRSSISNSGSTPQPLRRISGDFNNLHHQQSIPSSGNSSANGSPTVATERLDFGQSPPVFPVATPPTVVVNRTRLQESSVSENGMDSVTSAVVRCLSSTRLKAAVDRLDRSIDGRLVNQGLIGKMVEQEPSDKGPVKRRLVKFTWQRGTKIGQGRFGKVYTAVNNDTGELMAVKEIALQRNDAQAMQKVADELKIMEGINHRNLVKYYGLEVHKEEMLIFMEFCAEGTLESLVASTKDGLPELLIRRYTYQLLNGVEMLHNHGIVHRDIKTANIFLTEEGNCLKIGDFGCAAKLKNHVTVAGELQGFYGTQAYMAPEMFVNTQVEGHGRAVDIWSVGCVVVEMASGQHPWAEFDTNVQIMFKVGNGERPIVPDSLIEEGHEFLSLCFEFYPKDRATVVELLDHNFVKAGEDDSLD